MQLFMNNDSYKNVERWFLYIKSLDEVKNAIDSMQKKLDSQGKRDNKVKENKDAGKFIDLPDAENGKLVVRFPPEASG